MAESRGPIAVSWFAALRLSAGRFSATGDSRLARRESPAAPFSCTSKRTAHGGRRFARPNNVPFADQIVLGVAASARQCELVLPTGPRQRAGWQHELVQIAHVAPARTDALDDSGGRRQSWAVSDEEPQLRHKASEDPTGQKYLTHLADTVDAYEMLPQRGTRIDCGTDRPAARPPSVGRNDSRASRVESVTLR